MAIQAKGVRTTKARGRLGREVLAKLGKAIESYLDEAMERDVPERFKILLAQCDQPLGTVQDKGPG